MISSLVVAPSEIEEFLYREARMLDERRFEEWLNLFTEDGYVWVPLKDEEQGAQTSLVNDDRELLETRVKRLRHPAIHSQNPPAQACRLVSNIFSREDDDGEIAVYSTFLMMEYRLEQRVFGGHYEHRLRKVNDDWKIAAKKITLVGSDAVMYNLGLPF